MSKTSDDCITPKWLLDALGEFDFDPCPCRAGQPWPTANYMLNEHTDGLFTPWEGRVWLNPPYSKPEKWIGKLRQHGNGIALLNVSTGTIWWHTFVNDASAVFFFEGRIRFYGPDGQLKKAISSKTGKASVSPRYDNALAIYGSGNVAAVMMAKEKGLIKGKMLVPIG